MPEERDRHGVEGVVISTSHAGLHAFVDFDNGERGVESGPNELRKLAISTGGERSDQQTIHDAGGIPAADHDVR